MDSAVAAPLPTPDLSLEIVPVWGRQSLMLGEEQGADVAGGPVVVSRLDFLLSGVALREEGGDWVPFDNCVASMHFDRGKGAMLIPSVPLKRFTAIRFSIGLGGAPTSPKTVAGPRTEPAMSLFTGLLRPDGALSCFSIEGRYQKIDGTFGSYGYHLSDEAGALQIEVPLKVEPTLSRTIRLAFDVEHIFRGRQPLAISHEGDSLPSANRIDLAEKLKANIATAFSVKSTITDRQSSLAAVRNIILPATSVTRATRTSCSQPHSAAHS